MNLGLFGGVLTLAACLSGFLRGEGFQANNLFQDAEKTASNREVKSRLWATLRQWSQRPGKASSFFKALLSCRRDRSLRPACQNIARPCPLKGSTRLRSAIFL